MDEDEDRLSYEEMRKRPYRVLVDPLTGSGTAYNYGVGVIADRASAELVAFALAHHVKAAPWDERLVDPVRPLPRPSWAPPGPLTGWTLYWLRNGKTTKQQLLATPLR